VNRLLHEPVARLREQGNERHVEALRELFGLDDAREQGTRNAQAKPGD
jgi:hypothetical protein